MRIATCREDGGGSYSLSLPPRKETDMEIKRIPPIVSEMPFQYDSQNFRLYRLLRYRYGIMRVPRPDCTDAVRSDLTRRVDDVRKALQPDRSLRGVRGWYVKNTTEWRKLESGKSVRFSFYELIWLGGPIL